MGPEQLRTPGPPRYATRGISVRRKPAKDEEKGETPSVRMHMPDSQLNGAERALQQSFRKLFYFNSLLLGAFVLLAYLPIHGLPDRKVHPPTVEMLQYQAVELPPAGGPLRLAGAWELTAGDRRFGGLSGLALDEGRFLAVSDLGAVVRFDRPSAIHPKAILQDLRIGPGRFGNKWSRDAESIARDPRGRGWWIGYEQYHSLWLYDDGFVHALASVDLGQLGWPDNRGAEGLLAEGDRLLVAAENGQDAVEAGPDGTKRSALNAGSEVADAARAPDGSSWLLLRSKGVNGISQSIAPLLRDGQNYRVGPGWPLPKDAFDNFEGMAIERLANGNWRFWLVTDDGHRVMARTLLVALDFAPPAHNKSPATSAGPSKLQTSRKP